MSSLSFPTRTATSDPRPRSGCPLPAPEPGRPDSLRVVPAGPRDFPLSFAEKLSPRQAAKRLGVTLSTVYRLIETEILEASKVGGRWVVYAQSVEALLDRRKNTNA